MICAKLFVKLKVLPGVWAGEGHSLVWKTCKMWSRLVGRMRWGPEMPVVLTSYDLPSLFHRFITTDP